MMGDHGARGGPAKFWGIIGILGGISGGGKKGTYKA